MILTERKSQILSALYLQADLTTREIAQQLQIKEHTVRRETEWLIESNIIRRQSFIDVYRLGFVQYELYLSLGAQKQASVNRFLKFILSSDRVAWVGQFSGEFQYVVTVCCRTPYDALEFISNLGRNAGIALTDRQMAIRLSYTEFRLKQFSSQKIGPDKLTFGSPGQETIDLLDHQILKELSRPGYLGNNEMAMKLGIAQSTCHARVQRLQQIGVIVGSTYVIDFSKIGIQAYSLLLKTRTHSAELTKALLTFCDNHPKVAFMTESIGAFDYKIGIHVTQPSDIVSASQQISDALDEELVSCSCLTSFDYLKVSRYPFKDLQ